MRCWFREFDFGNRDDRARDLAAPGSVPNIVHTPILRGHGLKRRTPGGILVSMSGRLILAGTPIGNLSDASPALVAALEEADVIAAEDTRRLRKLVSGLGLTVSAKVVSFFDGNEAERSSELVARLHGGAVVVVVSDAGMPTVSDPGFRLVRQAVAEDVDVRVVPGPSAVLVALALSGLPTDRFCFEGFLPRKPGERRARLESLRAEERTMVFFESPHRLSALLADAAAVFGPGRQASVSRELTKLHEETRRGPLADLAAWAAPGVRGELTIVISGGEPTPTPFPEALAQVQALIASGTPLSAAVSEVAASTDIPRRKLYQAALEAK
jgi:16S rRNA (cytidine1402-2'-O)-methyltransferase